MFGFVHGLEESGGEGNDSGSGGTGAGLVGIGGVCGLTERSGTIAVVGGLLGVSDSSFISSWGVVSWIGSENGNAGRTGSGIGDVLGVVGVRIGSSGESSTVGELDAEIVSSTGGVRKTRHFLCWTGLVNDHERSLTNQTRKASRLEDNMTIIIDKVCLLYSTVFFRSRMARPMTSTFGFGIIIIRTEALLPIRIKTHGIQ